MKPFYQGGEGTKRLTVQDLSDRGAHGPALLFPSAELPLSLSLSLSSFSHGRKLLLLLSLGPICASGSTTPFLGMIRSQSRGIHASCDRVMGEQDHERVLGIGNVGGLKCIGMPRGFDVLR